jgi:hypothetical protein
MLNEKLTPIKTKREHHKVCHFMDLTKEENLKY